MFQQPARGQYREFQSDDSESEREDAPTHQILPQGTRKNRWHHIQGRVFLYLPIIVIKKTKIFGFLRLKMFLLGKSRSSRTI